MADVAVANLPAAPAAAEGASEHESNPRSQPAPEATPTAAAQSPPKRPRSEEPGEGDGDHKRLKPNDENASLNLDLGAMLETALLSFQEPQPPPAKEPSAPAEPIPKQEIFAPPPVPQPRRRPPKPPPKKMVFIENPVYFVRAMNLQLLGNLAVQILLALFQQPREESDRVLRVEQSEAGKVFKALKETFYQHLRLFSDSTKLLRADDLDISEMGDRETIEMVNLANFCVSCSFGPGGPTMAEMHEQFLKTFIPEAGAMSEELARVYLSQKTQSYLAYAKVIDDTNEARAHLLNRFFPATLEGTLGRLHSEAQLSIPEADFVAPFKAMRTLLQTDGNVSEKRKALEEKYPFAGFLDELSSYMRSNMAGVLEYADSHGINIPVIEDSDLGDDGQDGFDETEVDGLAAALQAASNSFMDIDHKPQGLETNGTDHAALSDSLGLGKLLQDSLQGQMAFQGDQGAMANGDDSKGLASLLFEKLGGGYEGDFTGNQAQANGPQAGNVAANQMYNNPYGSQFAQAQYYPYQQPMAQQQGSGQETADGLPPTQSLPTSVLYERARQAAVAKSSAHARREGLHSTRRPWTPEEEKALMAGLDMVKGPHWSQILQLFGQNGTLSDILKDRTQVQLKDKARNLKLFFLKTNSEMPYYLQCVTGELKTRAPSQAARKEAEERARLNSEEEQARIQGIMTLAGGLQNNPPATNGKSVAHSNGLPSGGPSHASPITSGVPVSSTGPAPAPQAMAPLQPAPAPAPVPVSTPAVHPEIKPEPVDVSSMPPPQPQPQSQPEPQAQSQPHNKTQQHAPEAHPTVGMGAPEAAMDANTTSASADFDLMQQLTAAIGSAT